jgi:ABC-type transport system substrate-binding protein
LSWDGWTQEYPDPQDSLSIYWACDAPNCTAWVGYCNEYFDELIARADRELDPAKRIPLHEEAERILIDDVPAIFVSNGTNAVLIKPSVTGYVTKPHDLWTGWTSRLTIDLQPRP